MNEDLRAWFGKGGKGGVGGGGWDRYNSSGDRIGKCGDAKEGDAYSACLSKEKAQKLGKAGRAAFVKRKRAAQKKGGDAKKGFEKSKGQKPIKVKTEMYIGINEIGEASAKAYKYKVAYDDPGYEIHYEFTTESKLKYQLSIAQIITNTRKKDVRLIVAFRPEGKTYDTITNKGEQFRIMATVVAAVKEYLATVPNATEISFTPSKADEGDMRRANLYKAYITKQLPGSKVDIFSDGRYIVTLPKKKIKEIVLREYTPSNPADIDKAIREIEKLGVRNPVNPKEIVIDNSVIIEVSNFDKRLWFSSLYSIDPGKGNASRVMKKIMDIVDKYKVTVALDPVPFGPKETRLSRSQLVKFYKSLGFKFQKGESQFGDMERISEIDFHSKLSRGHKPDWFQLHSAEFKPFDKSRDDVKTENFADGKNPGRKGLSKRFGISQKMTIDQLQKIAKSSTGEKRRMAQWNLNMKRGKLKKENLDPTTYKDTGKAAPYGSGYQALEERLNLFLEKNVPTDKSKWSYYKSQAKKKFDVYPSAYANAWAAKMYKKAGGRWRKTESMTNESNLIGVSKPYKLQVGDMVRNTNPACTHYKSTGEVIYVHDDGDITYQVNNKGATYTPGDELTKSADQLIKIFTHTPRPGYGMFSNE